MARLRTGVPLWPARKSGRQKFNYPSLDAELTADVVIVGGGLTGAVLAWSFSRADISVVLLEAREAGRGSTAVNTGLLMQEPDKDYRELIRLYGAAAARRVWQLSRDATRDFIRTLRRLEIDCDLVERPSVYYTLRPEVASSLHDEHRRRAADGFRGRWLDASALLEVTGIAGAAGILSRGNAQLDPYRACLGLMHAARKNGARIFERSPVGRIRAAKDGVKAVTRGGTVFARQAVIATGYATPEFRPLAARFKMNDTYVLTTERIPGRLRERLGLGDVMLWDTEKPYHYARWTPDHRLLLGGGDRPHVAERRRAGALVEQRRTLGDYFDRVLPALRDVRIDCASEGLFATTVDGLPYIGPHRRFPRHLFALGYGGNGMTYAFLAARLLVPWFRGRRSADHKLFAFGRHGR